MRTVQILSALALKRLLRPAASNEDRAALKLRELGAKILAGAGHHLGRALRQANSRAWFAVELVLAGQPLWERAQLDWQRELDGEFFEPLRALIHGVPRTSFAKIGPDHRRVLQSLQATAQSGLLTSGSLELDEFLPEGLLQLAAPNARAEWQTLRRLADDLQQSGYSDLLGLFELQWGEENSLLVALVTALVRESIEADSDLFGEFPWPNDTNSSAHDLGGVAVMLSRHRARLEGLLAEFRKPNTESVAPAATVDTDAGAVRFERGLAHAQRGAYDQAIAEFTAAIQADPASAHSFLHRAEAYRLKGVYAQAVADYNSALKLDPANALALFNRGQIHWMMGQCEQARADFDATLEIEPTNSAAFHYRGKALAAVGDFDGATANFSEALRLDPFNTWAYHDCGDAFAAKEDYRLAINNYSEAIRLNPLASLSYLRRAEAYAAREEFERAIADYGNILRLDPNNVEAYRGRGAAYRRQGTFDKAAEDLTRALEFELSNPWLFYERALLFIEQANLDRALLDLNAAVSLRLHEAEVFFHRGQTHQKLGNSDQAIADLSRALQIDSDHAEAYISRGMLYAERSELDLAVGDFGDAIRVEPDNTEAHVQRAQVLLRAGQLKEAIADCDRVISSDANSASAYLVRGKIHLRENRFKSAVIDLTHALRIAQEPQAYYIRALALGKLQNFRQAVADLTEAIRLDANHARAYAQRAVFRKSAGQQELALDDFAHAARLDASLTAAYCCQLGLVHSSQGNYVRSMADYSVALLLDPENVAARNARDAAWKAYQSTPKKSQQKVRQVRDNTTANNVAIAASAEHTVNGAQQGHGAHQGSETSGTGKDTALHPPANETATDTDALADEPVSQPQQKKSRNAEGAATPRPKKLNLASSDTPRQPQKIELADANTPIPQKSSAASSEEDDDSSHYEVSQDEESSHQETHEDVSGNEASQNDVSFDDTPVDPSEFQILDEDNAAYEAEQELLRQKQNEERLARMADEFRLAQEQENAKRREAAASAAAAKKASKPKKKTYDDDDDDFSMPLWKKGMLVAASIMALWWTGSAAMGFISSRSAMQKASTWPVTGKVFIEGNEPLSKGAVIFTPKDRPGRAPYGLLTQDGTFKLSCYSKDDGAPYGEYNVTILPESVKLESGQITEIEERIPGKYRTVLTTPLVVSVKNTENTFEFKLDR